MPRLLLGLLLAGAQWNAQAFGTQDDRTQNAMTVEFGKLDSNHDGRLSRSEAVRDEDIAPRFGDVDSNRDGNLSLEEYASVKSALQRARMEVFLQDSAVTARIKTELLKDSGIKGLVISVETLKGTVILSGFVDNKQQMRRAVEIASGVRGVHSIKNSLQLKG